MTTRDYKKIRAIAQKSVLDGGNWKVVRFPIYQEDTRTDAEILAGLINGHVTPFDGWVSSESSVYTENRRHAFYTHDQKSDQEARDEARAKKEAKEDAERAERMAVIAAEEAREADEAEAFQNEKHKDGKVLVGWEFIPESKCRICFEDGSEVVAHGALSNYAEPRMGKKFDVQQYPYFLK